MSYSREFTKLAAVKSIDCSPGFKPCPCSLTVIVGMLLHYATVYSSVMTATPQGCSED